MFALNLLVTWSLQRVHTVAREGTKKVYQGITMLISPTKLASRIADSFAAPSVLFRLHKAELQLPDLKEDTEKLHTGIGRHF